ncbi:type II and III secretion system protein family protein [Rhizobium sp. L1K21]|uniref:type II and III secretion system protein family protein n=1 Tax=Rhizobium sp. L1K21 TaxID=2954933 RepID=UPI0035932A88
MLGLPSTIIPVYGPSPAYAAESIIKISQAGPGVTRHVKLGLNKALVIDLPEDAHDILVADPVKADAITRTSRRIYLFGKAVGQTNIFVFGEDGSQIVSIEIEVERDISNLEAQLKRFLPDSDIKVEIISDNIVLTGTVRTPQDAAQATNLADIFLTGGEATTRNTVASGEGTSSSVAIFAEQRQKSQIVNLLQIEGEDQVTLKVTVAEVSRQVIKQLGINTSSTINGNNILFQSPTNLGGAVNWMSQKLASAAIGGVDFESYFNAMERAGVMRTLAEPSLTAISGEQAKFYVGGEFNMDSTQYVGNIGPDGTAESVSRSAASTVEYGIRLNFVPVVLSAGRISLKIETEVSEPTYEGSSVSGAALNVPGLTTLSVRRREASTTVELPSGGSIVIAGLVKDNIRQAFSGNPALAKVPVIGTLFRSKDFQRNETELVIIATPYLVRPVAADQLARPDDNFIPENDAATFFLNNVNKVYGLKPEATQGERYHGAVGFIYK